ncbi:minor tail protein [Mycobacterium phage Pipefish]|uniref:Minor tail protein n=1 Tax=Mycobacterium phage Pipefish TaxID=373413 RepID=Q19YX5_9CAUD|nr:gp30 [Mycobacterium phage Pipefish]ABD58527.1 minor tail protein [Mycobacterium phage Pipefish]
MPFRGYFALNDQEIANSARVVAHLGRNVPVMDDGIFGPSEADCSLEEYSEGLAVIPASSVVVSEGLATPPPGSRQFGPGLAEIDGTCWGPANLCGDCGTLVQYDDSWPGLREFLGFDHVYRPELAPWYSTEQPESAEFGGVWVMSVTGLDATPVERTITQMVGSGAVAGIHRDASRTITFDALLVGCTNAGVEYGLKWLTCLLRDTTENDDGVLRYLAAHPSWSGVDPHDLVREARNVVLTQSPTIKEEYTTGGRQHQQSSLYRVTWEMAALSPYVYFPAVDVPVLWDEVSQQPINWVHAAHCTKPQTCLDMPVLYSATCVPQEIEKISVPPPVCGGCLPVGGITKYMFRVPTMDYAFRCRETAVTTRIQNLGSEPLTLQMFWRQCGSDIRCEDNRFPLQVAGLPVNTSLVLDGITGKFWAVYDDRAHRPIGVVGTPTGAPWRPPIIDRQECWELVVQTDSAARFDVKLTLADREP